jgi:hypothetical protein
MVGINPALAPIVVDERMLLRSRFIGKQFSGFLDCLALRDAASLTARGLLRVEAPNRQLLLGVIGLDWLRRLFREVFDESEFLTPHGLQAISAYHREHPYVLEVGGI